MPAPQPPSHTPNLKRNCILFVKAPSHVPCHAIHDLSEHVQAILNLALNAKPLKSRPTTNASSRQHGAGSREPGAGRAAGSGAASAERQQTADSRQQAAGSSRRSRSPVEVGVGERSKSRQQAASGMQQAAHSSRSSARRSRSPVGVGAGVRARVGLSRSRSTVVAVKAVVAGLGAEARQQQ